MRKSQGSFRPAALRSEKPARLVARGARPPGQGEGQLCDHDARHRPIARTSAKEISPKKTTRTSPRTTRIRRTRKAPTRTRRRRKQPSAPKTASSNFAATAGRKSMRAASMKRSPRSRAKACRSSGSACRRSAAPNPPPTPSTSTTFIAPAPSAPARSMSTSGTALSTKPASSPATVPTTRARCAGCDRATASTSPRPARASSRISSNAKSAAI